MARSRNLKPGFFLNEKLADLSPLVRLLFAGLWCLADREGRLMDRPKQIKVQVLPYDRCNVDQMLVQLQSRDFIRRYTVGEGHYIEVVNFRKHQSPHVKEPASTIPAPCESGTDTILEPCKTDAKTPDSGFRIPDSGLLIADSSTPLPPNGFNRDLTEKEQDLSIAIDFWQHNQGNLGNITPHELGRLREFQGKGLDGACLVEGMKRAVDNRVFKMAYLAGIYNRWIAAGVHHIEDVANADDGRRYRKGKEKSYRQDEPTGVVIPLSAEDVRKSAELTRQLAERLDLNRVVTK